MTKQHIIPTFPMITEVHDALLKTPSLAQKNGVLLMGMSGAGKSTLFNHIFGIDYIIHQRGGVKQAIPQGKEWSKSSHRTCSETKHPVAVELEGGELTIIDMPGMADTRENVEQKIAEAHTQAIMKQLASISSLILVSSWTDITHQRMNGFRVVAEQIGTWINELGVLPKNMSMVITKGPKSLSKPVVHDCLRQLADDESLDLNDQVVSIDKNSTEPQLWKRHCLSLTIKALLASTKQIYISDLENPNNRKKILAMIHNQAIHSIDTQSYSKGRISENLNRLRIQIITSSREYLKVLDKINVILNQKNKRIKELQAEIKSMAAEKGHHNSQLEAQLDTCKRKKSSIKEKMDGILLTKKSMLNTFMVETGRKEQALLELKRLEHQDRNIDKSSYDIFAWGIIDNSNELRYAIAKRNHDKYLQTQSTKNESERSIKQLNEALKKQDLAIHKTETDLHHAKKELAKLERKLRMTKEIENQRNERLQKELTLKINKLKQYEEEKRSVVNDLYMLESHIPYLKKCLLLVEHLGLKDDTNKTLAKLAKAIKGNKTEKKVTLFSLGIGKARNGGSKKRFEIR